MKHIVVLCLVAIVLPACHKGKMKRKACSYPVTEARFGSGFISIPNIFTPDGDGQFDVWRFQHEGVTEISLRVEDRVGRNAWRTDDVNGIWEGLNEKGKELEGLLYYHVVARADSGELFDTTSYVAVVRDSEKFCPKQLEECSFESELFNGSIVETELSKNYKATFPCR